VEALTAAKTDTFADQACEATPGIAELLRTLREREQRVEAAEDRVSQRARTFEVAEEEIGRQLLLLQETETALRATMALAETAAEDDVARLTAVYENMKPKDAVPLFEAMAPDFAAGFLGRMRPDAAAGVLAGLSPDAAYTISVILAGRNANVPTR
jgi:flagellar motility protein MotE (MotC chaperone)